MLVSLTVAGALGWFLWDTAVDQKEAMDVQAMQNDAAAMAAARFQTVPTVQTDTMAMTRCVQAGTIALQFLQANNDRMYRLWKTNEAAACKAAGISKP